MLDSSIKLYQINIPELSGYISLFVSGQTVTTGIINYYVNSGAVLTGQTGNFVSIPYLNSIIAAQNVYNTFYYYPNSNPSGFVTNSQTGIFVDTINTQSISGLKVFTNAIGGTSLYGYGGGFGTVDLMHGQLSASGIETLDWGQQQLLGNWNLGIATGLFITTGQTGSFSSSGNYYPLNANPSGYITTGQTGAFAGGSNTGILTGAFYPRFSNPSSFIVPSQTGAFASNISLNATGNYLFSLINASSAGVSSLNTASGALTLGGAGNISIYTAGQTITISGNTGSFITTGMTGSFASTTSLNSTGATLQNNIISINNWTGSSTGLYYPYHTNPLSYITTGQTGAFGGSVSTGQLTGAFYPLYNNPLGYILPSQTGIFVDTINNQNVGGTKIFTSPIGGTSFYDYINEFGTVDVYNAQLNASGSITVDWGQQQLLYGDQPVFDWKNGLIYDNNIIFGQIESIDTNNRLLTTRVSNSSFTTTLDWQNSILYGNWNLGNSTGNFITTGQTGAFGSGGNTGVLTGAFYPLNFNPFGYITTGQTGTFASNTSLLTTGAILQTEINTLNSWTGSTTSLFAGTSNWANSGRNFVNTGEAHFYNNNFIDTASVGYTALKLSVSGDPTLTNNNAALAITSSGNLAFGHASYGVYVNNISVTTGSNTYAFFSLNGINYFAGPTSGTIFSGQSFVSGNTNLGNYFVNTGQTGIFLTNAVTGSFASIISLNATGQLLQNEVNTVSGNLITTGSNLQSQIYQRSYDSIYNGLIFYAPLNDGSGVAIERINGLSGIFTGTYTGNGSNYGFWSSGVLGSGIGLFQNNNGGSPTGAYMMFLNSSNIASGLTPITVSIWVNLISGNPQGENIVFSKFQAGTNGEFFLAYVQSSNTIGFSSNALGGRQNILSNTLPYNLIDNNWHNIVATYNGTTTQCYLDGSAVSMSNPLAQSGQLSGSNNPWQIGYPNISFCPNGNFSEAMAWNRILSPQEINYINDKFAYNFTSTNLAYNKNTIFSGPITGNSSKFNSGIFSQTLTISGQNVTTGGPYVLISQTGNFITTGQTGAFAGGSTPTGQLTGAFYPLNSNPSGYLSSYNQSGAYIFSTPVTSGVSQQFINFPTSLGVNPTVLCSLTNASGYENILVQASGIANTGYWALFSKTIDTLGYNVSTLASLSTATGLATTVIVNNLTGSYYPLTGNPAGYLTTGNVGNYIPLTGDFQQYSLHYNAIPIISTFSSSGVYMSSGVFNDSFVSIGDTNNCYINVFNQKNSISGNITYPTSEINTYSNILSLRGVLTYFDGFIGFNEVNQIGYLGDYNQDYNGTYIQVNDSTDFQSITLQANNPIISTPILNQEFTIQTAKINFTKTGNYSLYQIPSGFLYCIDSMEVITTNITSPSQAPYISFGNTTNYSGYTSPIQTVSNFQYSRHIFSNPQDAIPGLTTISFTVNTASTAIQHSGYAIVKGYLINQ